MSGLYLGAGLLAGAQLANLVYALLKAEDL